jgi:hypothetical protein
LYSHCNMFARKMLPKVSRRSLSKS